MALIHSISLRCYVLYGKFNVQFGVISRSLYNNLGFPFQSSASILILKEYCVLIAKVKCKTLSHPSNGEGKVFFHSRQVKTIEA
jgi:hypothetical protein